MIGSLRGVLLERWEGEVLVEVAGVGHRVTASAAAVSSLGEANSEVFVYIHDHRREDARTLYGFAERDELVCFESLLSAHGVGPSLALAILSVLPPSSLYRVVAEEDVDALCAVPGVGKKTAARLLVELSSRVPAPGALSEGVDVASSPAAGVSNGVLGDVREALVSLGYGPDEIAHAIDGLADDDDAASLVRQALGRLAVR